MAPLHVVLLVALQGPDLSAFATLERDPPPAEITRGAHYWIGNEDRLDLFHAAVKDKGGVHMGVGAEQNWLLCGWSRCEVAVLMDFDQSIVDLQRVYFAAFAAAETKEAFLALWLDKRRTGLREAINARYTGAERKGAIAALDVARWNVERRFKILETQMKAAGLTTFYTDDADYAHVRGVVVGGRAFAVRGDLTATKAVKSIAAAVDKAGMKVRTLYLSNAEQYFGYSKQVRENYLALPMDDASVVVRTHGWNTLRYAKNGNQYHYGIQSGPSLKAFMADKLVTSSRVLLQWAPQHLEKGCSLQTSTSAAEAKATYEAERKQKKVVPKVKAKAPTKTPEAPAPPPPEAPAAPRTIPTPVAPSPN
jgi:hypothetical protein